VVDDHGRTSGPAIFAAGDCTRFPAPTRLYGFENWRHAQDHGAAIGRNAAGGDIAYNPVPSFWSEQYDLYIQGTGWPHAQRPIVCGGKSCHGGDAVELDGGRLAFAMGINAQRDIASARRLIERRIPVDANELADPTKPLANMLKAKG